MTSRFKSIEEAARYSGIQEEAYHFVLEALQHAIDKVSQSSGQGPRHLHAHELLDGFVDYCAIKFGMLADTVLREWNVTSNDDIAKIVYQLIELNILKKSDEDRFDDFEGAPDLYEAISSSKNHFSQ